MERKIVTVDGNLRLPIAVESQITSGIQANLDATRDIVSTAHDGAIYADGTTNDYTAFMAAVTRAVNLKVPLALTPGASIATSTKIVLPAGLTVIANGATIKGLGGTAAGYVLEISSDVTIIGTLKVVTATGATDVRGVLISGDRVDIDTLWVTAPAVGAGAVDNNDCAVTMSGADDCHIGVIRVSNFDYPVKIDTCARVNIGNVNLTNYVRGIYIHDCTGVRIDGGVIQTASPNAAVSAGHNGVLIDASAHDATTDLHFTNIEVRNSGEHGWRIGGSKRVKRVWYTSCSAVSTGACGFKVLGGTVDDANYHEDITFTSCIVEDAGQATTNAAAFMAQFVKRVTIVAPIVRKNAKAYSAGHGFDIQAAEDVMVINPVVRDTLVAGWAVLNVLGDCTNVKLMGGVFTTTAGDGILIDYTGRTFRRVSVEGFPQVEVGGGGYAVKVVNTSGGAITGGAWLTWQSVQPAANQATGVLSGYYCDVRAGFTGTPAFKDGSTWTDNSTGVRRVKDAGTWKTYVLA